MAKKSLEKRKGSISVVGARGKQASLPFSDLAHDILGTGYELSVAFVNAATSKKLNKNYRGKNKPTNVLSFPLDKNSGELVLCMEVIKQQYKTWEKTLYEFTGFLVIHGMLHLVGMDHGSIMEKQEEKLYAKYFDRHRLGDVHRARSGGGVSKRRKRS